MKKRQGVCGCSLCLGLVWTTRSDWRLKEGNYARPKRIYEFRCRRGRDDAKVGIKVKVNHQAAIIVDADRKYLRKLSGEKVRL